MAEQIKKTTAKASAPAVKKPATKAPTSVAKAPVKTAAKPATKAPAKTAAKTVEKTAVKPAAKAVAPEAKVESKVIAVKKVAASPAKKAYNGPKVKITLIKSSVSCLAKQKKTLEALGLRKIRQEVIKRDDACTRGMIFVVRHLVSVEEVK